MLEWLGRVLCALGFHKFTKWKNEEMTLHQTYGGVRTGKSDVCDVQTRVCQRCDLFKYRSLEDF